MLAFHKYAQDVSIELGDQRPDAELRLTIIADQTVIGFIGKNESIQWVGKLYA